MGLTLAIAAPGVKRVVHHHAVLEHRIVVPEVGREPERQGEQAWRLRRELEMCGVGPAHDQRERAEGRVVDGVNIEKRIETAQLTVMQEWVGAGDVIGDGAGRLRHVEHLLGRDVEEGSLWVDKSADQPRAGDAVYFRALASDPAGRALRELMPSRQFGFCPRCNAAFEIARRRTDLAQDGGGALTDLAAMRAIDDDRGSGRDLAAPSLDFFWRAVNCAGNYPFIGFEDRASADIDQLRRGGSAEPAIQIGCGY